MKNILGFSLTLLFISMFTSTVFADSAFYVGGSIGQSYVEEDNALGNEDFDDEDFGFKAFAGYQPHKNFAVELNYLDFGDPDDNIQGIDAEIEDLFAIALYGVGKLPVTNQLELFVKIGAAYWEGDAKASFMGVSVSNEEDGTELAYGLGATYAFTDKYAARVEYEEIDVDSDDLSTLGLLTIGGEIRF